jgi:hypothetical protein
MFLRKQPCASNDLIRHARQHLVDEARPAELALVNLVKILNHIFVPRA